MNVSSFIMQKTWKRRKYNENNLNEKSEEVERDRARYPGGFRGCAAAGHRRMVLHRAEPDRTGRGVGYRTDDQPSVRLTDRCTQPRHQHSTAAGVLAAAESRHDTEDHPHGHLHECDPGPRVCALSMAVRR